MVNNNKIHSLHITRWFPNKNDPQLGVFVEKHAQAIAQHCQVSLVHCCSLESEKFSGFQLEEFTADNYQALNIYFNPSRIPVLGSFLNFIRYWKGIHLGVERLERQQGKADILHAHVLVRTAILAYLFGKKGHRPFLISDHWTGFSTGEYNKYPGFVKYFCRWIVARANALTVVSPTLKVSMKSHGLTNKNSLIIGNVVEELHYSQAKAGLIQFLTVADLIDDKKNVSDVIRVVAQLKNEGKEFLYHIIGGGADETVLRKLASELGVLDSHVQFHGRQSNSYVLDFLSKVHFVVINSISETFSVFCGEALSSGRAVITTRCGGPELLLNENCGLIIEPQANEELKKAILHMFENWSNYKPAELKAHIMKNFNSEKIGLQFYKLYEELLLKK
jgi:glycosyltransferase involved in cell wall biosynthesis